MTNPNKTDITILLDRSGSMVAIQEAMESGINHYINSQKDVPGECHLTVYTFDDIGYEAVEWHRRIQDVQPIKLRPRGNTPLLDSVARAIDETGYRLRQAPELARPGKVIFIVITDGQENASRHTTRRQVADRVRLQTEAYQWEFVYIGANQDSWAEAGNLNFCRGNTITYAATTEGINALFAATAVNTRNYRGGASASMGYTVEQKAEQDDELKKAGQTVTNTADEDTDGKS